MLLSQRLQRLTLKAAEWTPQRVLSLFHPSCVPAASSNAAGGTGDQLSVPHPASPAGQELLRVLLAKDVKDNFGRNVLHLAVTRR